MKKTLECCIDIQKLCDVKGRIHIYFIDVNNTILACNKIREEFIKDMLGCDQVVGKNLKDFMDKDNFISEFNLEENEQILKTGIPAQFYQSWFVKNAYRLDLLTCKFPIYDASGKPLGILATSHILNRFSVERAHKLGLTKREIECLFYLFEGNTAKEIGKILNISPRTVEGYIDSMKNKLNCSTVSELLLIAMENDVRSSLETLTDGVKLDPPFSEKTGVRVNII